MGKVIEGRKINDFRRNNVKNVKRLFKFIYWNRFKFVKKLKKNKIILVLRVNLFKLDIELIVISCRFIYMI